MKLIKSVTFVLALSITTSAMADNSSSSFFSAFSKFTQKAEDTAQQAKAKQKQLEEQTQQLYSLANKFVQQENVQAVINSRPQNSKAMLMCMASNDQVLQANRGVKTVLTRKIANLSDAEVRSYLIQAVQNGSIVPVIKGLGLSIVAEDGTIFNQNNKQLLQSAMAFSTATSQCAKQTNFTFGK